MNYQTCENTTNYIVHQLSEESLKNLANVKKITILCIFILTNQSHDFIAYQHSYYLQRFIIIAFIYELITKIYKLLLGMIRNAGSCIRLNVFCSTSLTQLSRTLKILVTLSMVSPETNFFTIVWFFEIVHNQVFGKFQANQIGIVQVHQTLQTHYLGSITNFAMRICLVLDTKPNIRNQEPYKFNS